MRFLHAETSPQTRALAVRYIWALWIIKVLIQPLGSLARLPAEAFTPAGVLFFLSDSMKGFLRDRFNTAYLQNKLLFIDDDLVEGI